MIGSYIRKNADILIFLVIAGFILTTDITRMNTCRVATQPGTTNMAIAGHPGDYFQYLQMISRGKAGSLKFHNTYTEVPVPDVYLQPLYPLAGILTDWTGISTVSLFHVLRITGLMVLFSSILILIRTVFQHMATRTVAVLLVASSSPFWLPVSLRPFNYLSLGLPYYPFGLTQRYHVLPPHHTLVIAGIIFACVLYAKKKPSPVIYIFLGILSCTIGLLHPYNVAILCAIFGAYSILTVLHERAQFNEQIQKFSIVLLSALPVFIYQAYVAFVIFKSNIPTQGIDWATLIPMNSYILSLGFTGILALPAIILSNRSHHLLRMLIVWAFLPFLLYFLPFIGIPLSVYRMFQMHQYIPLSLLSAFTLTVILRKYASSYIPVLVISVGLSIYGLIPYVHDSLDFYTPDRVSRYCLYIPGSLVSAIEFIKSNIPDDTVILTDESVGLMLPAYTNTAVMVGHEGNNADYASKLNMVRAFFENAYTVPEASAFLTSHHISFILFGYGSPELDTSAYTTLVTPVYAKDGITIARVK